MNKSVPTLGVGLPQQTKYVHSLRAWMVIIVAGVLFFMSMSSLTWGLTSLINQDINGVWYVTGGALLQGGAISSVWAVEKKALTRPARS
ncbi:hypothetical protein [Spirosoma fluviale]|uniref:Uncharacterized protein n=1 Tax=Spirosoma fluviale TaxID=1597977 RepID=A0A286F9M9_9BACT|nr:hypothetical protein [Spirosoma fluviale]SOD79564.1 hypothetical protein SAMN06269250_1001 [Spirosoma fluviale]